MAARCGTLEVPEDRADPDGPRIGLRVAVVPAMAREAAPDPVVFIAGGPGQASTEAFVSMAMAFAQIRRERDVVLVDQRGTGSSNALECPVPEGDPPDPDDTAALEAAITECLAQLAGDPRHYGSSQAVADLDAVREALGYRTWNIYGISYGTRVAQHYLRRYPERTRSLILDGVVPPTMALGPDVSVQAQRALDLAFQRCAADQACAEAFPDLAASFERLQQRLALAQPLVTIPDPLTARPVEVPLGVDELGVAIRLLSYLPETVSLLPLLIHTAEVEGDLRPMAAQVSLIAGQFVEGFSMGMHNAVVCTEDAPHYRGEQDAQGLDSTYLGPLQYDALREVCARWPVGVADPDIKDPLVSDVPVLLLSGEADPITPPAYAELAAEQLSQHRHLVGTGQGHGIAARGCVPSLMDRFITDLDPAGLDASCMERMRPAPFFTSFSGPEP